MVSSTNGELAPDDVTGAHSNTPINNNGHQDEEKSETKYVLYTIQLKIISIVYSVHPAVFTQFSKKTCSQNFESMF